LSKWPGKYVIGLTGNIATGKSVVRKMLEHLGAYGIDADAFSHRAIARGAPGYQPTIEMFGRWILNPQGEIDRARLGKVVFSDPAALAALEAIVHPLVTQAVDVIITRSTQPVVVVEAIKLLETGMARNYDSIWVSFSPPDVQLARLVQNRKMGEPEARQRIAAQPAQDKKVTAAQVVIRNVSTFADTWRQVMTAWQKSVPARPEAAAPAPAGPRGQLTTERGRPRHAVDISAFLGKFARDKGPHTPDDIMAAFGEKAFLLLQLDRKLVGVIGWQVENLVSRTTDIFLDPSIPLSESMTVLMNEMERASRELQCEASLLFVQPDLAKNEAMWKKLGYERITVEALGAQAWQEAASESMPAGTTLFFKQLRQDRVLRPI
jgi:dephospho-CoA kinase